MKALSLWENFHFGPFEDLSQDYVCKAMYSFACPKIEKHAFTTYKIPLEILEQAKPEDFELSLEISFGKKKQIKKISIEECENWKENFYMRRFNLPSFWEIGFLKQWRILSQAKALLRIELEAADISGQIQKDFYSVYKDSDSIFSIPNVGMSLSYDHKRILGIKTKKDSMNEYDIQLMCGLSGIGAGNLNDPSNKTDIPQWCEPFIFMNPPYNRHYMCFSNHGLWDHCHLNGSQILNLKPGNFSWNCDVSFNRFKPCSKESIKNKNSQEEDY